MYLEASAGAPVLAALRVEGEELAGEDARQRRLLVGTVVHAGRSLAAANRNRARCGQVETTRIHGSRHMNPLIDVQGRGHQ